MKAVILVGGEGTRLRPLTCNIPKPMVPVVNRPFLEHTFSYLKRHNIDEVILAMGYLPHRIKEHFSDGKDYGIKLTYEVEDSPMGTGGAVKRLERQLDDTFVVMNGDVYTDLDITEMLETHKEKKSVCTIAMVPVEDPTKYGVIETSPANKIRKFTEKPGWDSVTSNNINAGTYIMEPKVLEEIPSSTFHMFEQGLFPKLLLGGESLYGFPLKGYWIDMGTVESYMKLHGDMLKGHAALNMPGKSKDGVRSDETAKIHRTAKIQGPVVIGPRCTVGPRARITGPVVLGAGCSIGEDSALEDCVLWRQASFGTQCTLNHCVIGNNAKIGNNVWVKSGSVVADDAVIGDGNKLENGIAIWPGHNLEPDSVTFVRR